VICADSHSKAQEWDSRSSISRGLLVAYHVVFGFFFALTAVTFARGAILWFETLAKRTAPSEVAMPIPVGGTEA
jgi:hypothetical protein